MLVKRKTKLVQIMGGTTSKIDSCVHITYGNEKTLTSK